MKILITTDLFTTDTNGVVTSVRNLRDELLHLGHEVRILTLSENRKSRKEGDVYYVKSASLEWVYPNVRMPLSYRNEYIRELIEWKPDVIHSQCEFFTYQYALKISKKTNAPIVHTYHTMYEDYVGYVIPFKRLGKWLIRKLIRIRLKKAKAIVVPTEKVKRSLESYGIADRLHTVPSGICLDRHRERISKSEREEKRRALGIHEDAKVIINLGRLGTEKNLEELIEYFGRAHKDYEDLYFLIVGDGPAKAKLERQSSELGLSGRIIFTGMVSPNEVHRYYQLADLFVSASTSETQGLTYVESMANGLPLLCRYDDCLLGVLINGENGYDYTTEDEFCEHLRRILSDDEWRVSAALRSEEISLRYDKSTFGSSVEEIYNSVIEKILQKK